MSTTQFFLRPLDVAFFGPPDAQAAGDTHYARSLFPPPPRAFQGLVRTRLLTAASLEHTLDDHSVQARREREQLVGGPETLPNGWQIEGPLPVTRSTTDPTDGCVGREHLVPWAPTPGFLFRHAKPGTPPLRAMLVDGGEQSDALGGVAGGTGPLRAIGTRGFVSQEPLGGWIDAANLLWALSGKGRWNSQAYAELPPMVKREPRVGLAIDTETRRAEDRMLYSVDQLRFDGKGGFMGGLQVTGGAPNRLPVDALTHGTAPFGRWHRLAALEPVSSLTPAWTRIVNAEHLPKEPEEGAKFWMVAITPFRIDGVGSSAQPGQGAFKPWSRGVAGLDSIEILGAVLGPDITLGGYSMATRQARPNQTYVPAGSSWLFRIPGVSKQRRGEILRQINNTHCLGPTEEARMGFGRVLLGLATDE